MRIVYQINQNKIFTGVTKTLNNSAIITSNWILVEPPVLAENEVARWINSEWRIIPKPNDLQVIQDIEEPQLNYGPFTHLQFIRRFTIEERAAFETLLADARSGTAGLDAATRGQVLVMGRSFDSAREVWLDDSETVAFVNALAELTIITPERATEILAP